MLHGSDGLEVIQYWISSGGFEVSDSRVTFYTTLIPTLLLLDDPKPWPEKSYSSLLAGLGFLRQDHDPGST